MLCLSIASCGKHVPRLRLSINEWPGFAYFRLADRKGLFDPSAVDVRLHLFRNPADQIRHYAEGGVDAVSFTLGDTIVVCARVPDRCPVIVQVIDESRGGDQLLGLPGYGTLASLERQPIGLDGSALSKYLIHRIFERAELAAPKSSQLRVAPPETFEEMLRSGEIKAVLTYPPASTQLQQKMNLEVVITTRSLPGEVLDVLAVAPEYLRRHPRAVAALIEGWRQARSQEQNSPDTVVPELASMLGIPEEQLRAEQKGVLYPGSQEQYQMLSDGSGNLMATLHREHDLLVTIGLIKPDTPLPSLDGRFIFPPPIPY